MLITSNILTDWYTKLFYECQICNESSGLDLRIIIDA